VSAEVTVLTTGQLLDDKFDIAYPHTKEIRSVFLQLANFWLGNSMASRLLHHFENSRFGRGCDDQNRQGTFLTKKTAYKQRQVLAWMLAWLFYRYLSSFLERSIVVERLSNQN
jgi:hypothetical protein